VTAEPIAARSSWRSQISRRLRPFDDAALAWSNRVRPHPRLDRTLYALSTLGDGGAVWFVAIGVEAVRRPEPLRFVGTTLGWFGVESIAVNGPMKSTARRHRPALQIEHRHRVRPPGGSSFPSGHAASAGVMAAILSQNSPLAPLWWALAAGIAVSRVHLGVHHGSDVVAGFGIGVAIGIVARTVTPAEGHRPR